MQPRLSSTIQRSTEGFVCASIPGRRCACVTALALACTAMAASPQTPQLNSTEKARAKEMLASVKSAIRENYYDRTYRGIDLDAHFKDGR